MTNTTPPKTLDELYSIPKKTSYTFDEVLDLVKNNLQKQESLKGTDMIDLPANLNPSGKKKLLEWVNYCFQHSCSKEHVKWLVNIWLEVHDVNGNIVKRSCDT